MPGLRLLLRMAPFVVGAVAMGVWLRRRGAERRALPAGMRVRELSVGEASGASVGEASGAPEGDASEALGGVSEAPRGVSEAPRGGANYTLKGEPVESSRPAEAGEPAESGGPAEPAQRFQREPIDIVTVVDDLLQAGR